MSDEEIDKEIKVCVIALLESFNDKDDYVNDAIQKSMCKISTGTNVNTILYTFCEFWNTKKKLDNFHLSNILRSLEQICMQLGECLESEAVKVTTDIIIKVMVSNKEYIPSVQLPASGILVAFGNFYCVEVLDPLVELLKPGIVPHFTIPHTIGTLAATNIKGTVPFIKPVLAKMLPTLGMLKMDPLKQAFAYALGHFSTALLDYFSNNENVDKEVTIDSYSTEISIAFDVLYMHWIHSGESKVIENVLEAMGPMFSILPAEKTKELTPKLITTIIALYKKSAVDSYYITQSLSFILLESVKKGNTLPTSLIESVIQAMFNLILTTPDYDQPQKVKNHFELLRCFDVLVTNFSNCALEYLFQQTKNNNEEDRMKATVILTHLVTSSESSVKIIVERFVITLKVMIVHEHSIKMKRILLKAIVALAYRNFLKEKEDTCLLEFIIKQCCCTKINDSIQFEKNIADDLINDCENSLYLLSSTVTNIKPLLWPILLRGLLSSDYSKSISIIGRCLTQLTKVQDTDRNVQSESSQAIPCNESIYVRCLSLLVNYSDHKMANNLLLFLSSYCENIHKDLKVSWELDLQKLISYLDSKEFTSEMWDSMILDLFRSTIYLVNENTWVETVSHKILEQIPQNEKCIQRKGILYKFLAILLCHVFDVQSVSHRLDVLFNALHNSDLKESKHIAQALGIASIKHGLSIVERLDSLSKDIESRKSNRFLSFNFMKNSKHDNDMNNMKYSITLCYGEVAKEALDENVLCRLIGTGVDENGGSIRWAATQLRLNNPPPHLVHSALTTVHLLARAIYTASPTNIVLRDKWNLLNLVLDQMFEQTENDVNVELYPPIIKATTSLILLPKHLAPEERNVVLRTVCSKVYNPVQFLKTTFETIEEENKNDIFAKVMNDSLCSLNNLIKEFMKQSTCPSTLDDVLSILDEWVDHDNDEVRAAAMRSVQVALICFIQNIKLTYENPSRFGQTGLIMGKMVPRSSDKSSVVRYIAIDCIRILIQIVELYEGRSIDANSEVMKKLSNIHTDIGTENLDSLYEHVSCLADIITCKVPHQQTLQLIESLLNGLHNDEISANGCNYVLNTLLESKGAELYQNVNDVMDYILNSLKNVDGGVRTALLETMLTFMKHHPKPVLEILLQQPLPFEKSINDCWRTVARDTSIAALTIEHLLSILSVEPLFEESLKYDNGKVVNVKSLTVISGLSEMFSQSQVQSICVQKFAEIFSILFTMLACFIGSSPPAHSGSRTDKFGFVPNLPSTKLSPPKVTLDTLKAFFINCNCEKAAEASLQCTQLESGEHLNSFLDMVPGLVEVFCKDYPNHLPKVVSSLNHQARDPLLPKRIAVVAFFSHLVSFRCNEHLILLETVMESLNIGWKDTALEVRAISLAGLSNIKHLKLEQQEQYLTPVLTALYNGLDDYQGSTPRTNVPLVAILGLNDLLSIKCMNAQSIEGYPPVSQRIKSFFNTDNPVLRESSILLFGEIVSRQKSDAIKEQALALFPCFLLHLADEDVNVVKACKRTLKKISPIFNAEKSNTMIQNHLIDSAKLHLEDFTMDLVKNISVELPKFIPQFIENTSNYLSSPWDNIRANAAIVIGMLFLNYKKCDDDYEMNRKRLTVRLLQLLKDTNPGVRARAASALCHLFQKGSHLQ